MAITTDARATTTLAHRYFKPVFRSIDTHRPLRWLLVLLLLATAVVAGTSVVFSEEGWPGNHEGLAWKFRTLVYAAHLQQGDLLPIWASEDMYGHGSPLPLFYHKAFYFTSAPLYLGLGNVKWSIYLAIAGWSLFGCLGIYRAARTLDAHWTVATAIASLLPFLNYTLLDWLVRGAFAEFSAYMCLPWIFHWCLRLLRTERFGVSLALWMALLVYAHSVIALFSMIPILIAVAIVLARHPRTFTRELLVKGSLSVLICSVALLPYLAAYSVIREGFDPSSVKNFGYSPSDHFWPARKYVHDSRFHPGGKEMWFSVQLNHTLLIAALVTLLWSLLNVRPRSDEASAPATVPGASLFLLSSLGVMFALQLRASNGLYDSVPGMDYLQFPWRLLSFVNPLLLLWLALRFAAMPRKSGSLLLPCLLTWLVLGTVLESPGVQPVRWNWISQAELEDPLLTGQSPGVAGTAAEYWPVSTQPDERDGDAPSQIHERLQSFRRQTSQGPVCLEGTARVRSPADGSRRDWERLTMRWRFACEGRSRVALPLTHSGLERVYRETERGRVPVLTHRRSDDHRVVIELPAGEHQVTVRLPTLGNLLR
ncbi:hypothetical protein Pan216_24450 [Planctomycetes bacterium Pan216]|uniref:Membrane protein 6-pyruvoyl-tetrahydropterin synthase-related domain-containing protein n=1 Tax=Kolteria novifilia TaxID=2527975 RepID=A0A518B3R5_9BACT|nr:hypothetical protein Pan216_24450 [Planctomycetes bacterium Pan216]